MEDRLRERETDLAQSHRQSADLAKQLDQPFEHEEKLATATKRQQEIITALDITKNQASPKIDESISEASAESLAEAVSAGSTHVPIHARHAPVVAKLT
jgi:spore germination cell wall hydrolase CwlJ-like protein